MLGVLVQLIATFPIAPVAVRLFESGDSRCLCGRVLND